MKQSSGDTFIEKSCFHFVDIHHGSVLFFLLHGMNVYIQEKICCLKWYVAYDLFWVYFEKCMWNAKEVNSYEVA